MLYPICGVSARPLSRADTQAAAASSSASGSEREEGIAREKARKQRRE